MKPSFVVTGSATIPAPAARVYAIIADYRNGHPRIVPPKYFTSLEVEQGGIGAGTVIRVTMRILGSTKTFRAAVTEPQPGRVLVEADEASGTVTSFTVEPLEERSCHVTIATDLKLRGGVLGMLERCIVRRLLKRIYAEELALLAAVASE